MTDGRNDGGTVVPLTIDIGTDEFGDPFLKVRFDMPPDHRMRPDTAEQLAAHLLGAAAAARSRARVARGMLMKGKTPEEVHEILGLLDGM